jgi:hypothetical protein
MMMNGEHPSFTILCSYFAFFIVLNLRKLPSGVLEGFLQRLLLILKI